MAQCVNARVDAVQPTLIYPARRSCRADADSLELSAADHPALLLG